MREIKKNSSMTPMRFDIRSLEGRVDRRVRSATLGPPTAAVAYRPTESSSTHSAEPAN